MPNMCICGDHYASHEGYNALTGDGGGKCLADRGKCPCEHFVDAALCEEAQKLGVAFVEPREDCPNCGAALLGNDRGDRACSRPGCSYWKMSLGGAA